MLTCYECSCGAAGMPEKSATPSVPSAERLLSILELLAATKTGLTLPELSRRLGLPKSSTHCLLVTLERRGYLQAGGFVPEVVLEHPEKVAELHREFVHAGSDVVEAFTYYAHREKLRLIGKPQLLEEINRQALAIAGEVAEESGTLLAGGICYTAGVTFFLWRKLPYHHAIWHVCVIAGSACHWLAVADTLAPSSP